MNLAITVTRENARTVVKGTIEFDIDVPDLLFGESNPNGATALGSLLAEKVASVGAVNQDAIIAKLREAGLK